VSFGGTLVEGNGNEFFQFLKRLGADLVGRLAVERQFYDAIVQSPRECLALKVVHFQLRGMSLSISLRGRRSLAPDGK
jgi:hypothetical protein